MEILTYPNRELAKKSIDVEVFDKSVEDLAREMITTMYASDGVGLAAPQVGEHKNMFVVAGVVINNRGDQSKAAKVFINPEIIWTSPEEESGIEGCLSFPGGWVHIKRPLGCNVRAKDINGEEFEVRTNGLYARVIQHEYDHLQGTLMPDRISNLKKRMLFKKMGLRK